MKTGMEKKTKNINPYPYRSSHHSYLAFIYLSTLDVSGSYDLVALSNPKDNTTYMEFTTCSSANIDSVLTVR